jgi:hypothetical protein
MSHIPQLKLTNLWMNYGTFLDALEVQSFKQYSVLKNWPSVIVERNSGWADFAYTILLAFKETPFAEIFDGYTSEEIIGIQLAITNKYDALLAKMLASLHGQSYSGVVFGVGYAVATKPPGNGPSPYSNKPSMLSVPRKNAGSNKAGTSGRYVREFRDDDQDIVVIDGVQNQITWIKQKAKDWGQLPNYAMKLKNLLDGSIIIIPNAVTNSEGSDSGYSGAFGVTKYHPVFLGYGSGRNGYDTMQPPYMTADLKAWLIKKLKGGKIESDKYPKGTTNDRIKSMSGLDF